MAIKTGGLEKKIHAIITNKTKDIFDSFQKSYKKVLNDTGTSWQKQIRKLLSVRRTGKANTSDWPMLRSGGLRRSIKAPHISRTKTRNRGIYYEAIMEFTPMYRKYKGNGMKWNGKVDKSMPKKSKYGGDISEVLNAWGTKPFYMWKRTASAKFHRMISEIKYNRRARGTAGKSVTRNYFIRDAHNIAEQRMYERS